MKPRLVIVGAGPAGVSAALWARERFEVLLIESTERAGGQLRAIHFVPLDLPGNDRMNGEELAEACARQIAQARIEVRCGAAATALEAPARARPAVRLERGKRIEADAVLIASGLRRRRLAIPGEAELEGRGVSTSATRDRSLLAGRDVLVVGGGDAAFENALRLAEVGSRVRLAVRGRARARREFRSRAAAEPRIEILTGTRVVAFLGTDRFEAARLESRGVVRERRFDGAVIKIGMVPNSEWCAGTVRTDAAGFVRADSSGRTSARGVWAAGDIVHPALFAISVAAAGAALAVLDVARALERRQGAPRAARGARKQIRPGRSSRANRGTAAAVRRKRPVTRRSSARG